MEKYKYYNTLSEYSKEYYRMMELWIENCTSRNECSWMRENKKKLYKENKIEFWKIFLQKATEYQNRLGIIPVIIIDLLYKNELTFSFRTGKDKDGYFTGYSVTFNLSNPTPIIEHEYPRDNIR